MMIESFSQGIKNAFVECIGRKYGKEIETAELVYPPENIDAEYAIPCFSLSKTLKTGPALIAREIAESIQLPEWAESAISAGPYLNIKIRPYALFKTVILQAIQENEKFGWQSCDRPEMIIVEYSSPNTNKPLHLGHIRNNVLGMAITNLLKARGHNVLPATILNDRGIHICKAMVAYREYGENSTPESAAMKGDHFVGKFYVKFSQACENRPELMEQAHEMLRAWEKGDPETIALWEKMNSWVYAGFDSTYQRLGSVFELTQYESQTYKLGREVVADGLIQGVFYREEDGAIGIDLTHVNLDKKTVIRADGTTLYLTQDLGVAVERFHRFRPDGVVYVVGSEQNYHFQVLFEVLRRLGFEWGDRCRHLSYGMVYLPEGKMKSREGKVVDADDLMDELKAMALQVMNQSGLSFEGEDQEQIAEAIGVGAIKYYILKINPQKDIHFDPVASLSFDGATGAYLQYVYARICSIQRKQNPDERAEASYHALGNSEEMAIIRQLLRYSEVVRSSADDLNPSKLALYLWDLAKAFNTFYANHRILEPNSPEQSADRLALSRAVASSLKSGLSLLGIQTVEKM